MTSRITIATIHGPLSLEADVTGEWAVHRSPFDARPATPALKAWTVTHVPTGLRITRDLTSRRARDLAERLSREVPTLGIPAVIHTVQPVLSDFAPEYVVVAKRVMSILAEVCP